MINDREETIEREEMDGIPQSSFHQSFQRLSKNKKQKESICNAAQEDFELIQAWKQTELKKFEQDDAYDNDLVTRYHQQQLVQNPKKKTISTPWGSSKSRSMKASVQIENEKELLEYAMSNHLSECIETRIKFGNIKGKLSVVGNKVVDQNGEIVPGASVKSAETTFSLAVE